MTDSHETHSGEIDSPPSNEPTIEILERARDGDQEAWASIHERYRSTLIRAVHGRIPRDMRARFGTEDVVQSTLIAAAKGLKSYRCLGKGSLQAWLFTSVRNRLVHRIRKDRSDLRDARRDVDVAMLANREDLRLMGPGEALLAAERHLQILEAIEELSKGDRELIDSVLSGTPPNRLAEELGCSETAARSRRADAIKRLSKRIRRKIPQS